MRNDGGWRVGDGEEGSRLRELGRLLPLLLEEEDGAADAGRLGVGEARVAAAAAAGRKGRRRGREEEVGREGTRRTRTRKVRSRC